MRSDTGRVRRQNQDACALAPELGAYVVCDGMGGAAGGEIASELAVRSFLHELAEGEPTGMPGPRERLERALAAANQTVHQHAMEHPRLEGMGTTMVALLHVPANDRRLRARPGVAREARYQEPPDLFLLNVGDSRCYRWRDGNLAQLSTDHSFVEEQLRAGQITAEQAASSPMRSYITRAVGPSRRVEADVESYRTRPGDVYLLCSDGLSRELTTEQIGAVLGRYLGERWSSGGGELETAAEALIASANEAGGHDNITVLLLGCC